jgi:glycerophosphoryl diester phosphodiesterase
MKRQMILSAILVFVCLISCQKIKYYGPKPVTDVKTRILSHRGGGDSEYPGDNLRAVQYGLPHLDGIEVDVQLSNDRTVWLSHSSILPPCSGVTVNCFTEAHDFEIIQLDSCLGNDYLFSTLDTVFYYLKTYYPEKCISIDVKAWNPCSVARSDIIGLMDVIAEEIIKLVTKYNLKDHVMVESETATFLNFVKRHSSGIGIYLTTLGDFERGIGLALESGFDGISFQYKFEEEITAEDVKMIHNKGLRIHLWTVNEPADIIEATSLNPDYIQTDNIDYFVSNYPPGK